VTTISSAIRPTRSTTYGGFLLVELPPALVFLLVVGGAGVRVVGAQHLPGAGEPPVDQDRVVRGDQDRLLDDLERVAGQRRVPVEGLRVVEAEGDVLLLLGLEERDGAVPGGGLVAGPVARLAVRPLGGVVVAA
jgi:hypothetical protein